jgi:hypothetical protein
MMLKGEFIKFCINMKIVIQLGKNPSKGQSPHYVYSTY